MLKPRAGKSFGRGWALVAPAPCGYYEQICCEEERFEEGLVAAAVDDVMAGASGASPRRDSLRWLFQCLDLLLLLWGRRKAGRAMRVWRSQEGARC